MKYETKTITSQHGIARERVREAGQEGWDVVWAFRDVGNTDVWLRRPVEEKEEPPGYPRCRHCGETMTADDQATHLLCLSRGKADPLVNPTKVREALANAVRLHDMMQKSDWIDQCRVDEMQAVVDLLTEALEDA